MFLLKALLYIRQQYDSAEFISSGLRRKTRYTTIKIASSIRKRIIGKVLHTRIEHKLLSVVKKRKIDFY